MGLFSILNTDGKIRGNKSKKTWIVQQFLGIDLLRDVEIRFFLGYIQRFWIHQQFFESTILDTFGRILDTFGRFLDTFERF